MNENDFIEYNDGFPAEGFGDDRELFEEQPPVSDAFEENPPAEEEDVAMQMNLQDFIPVPEKEKTESAKESQDPEDPEDSVDPTIDYYNKNAELYYERSIRADLHEQHQLFMKYLSTGARILDLGCGSGRDTKFFRDNGYNVTAIDGSEEMCRLAESYTGVSVRQMEFLDLNDREIYAGIWASASLIHVKKQDMIRMFAKLRKAMTKDGILFVSFREGNFDGIRDGRHFSDLTEGELFNYVNTVGGMKIISTKRFKEVRDEEEITWLCAIIKKW